jgi:hypothetical protein
MDLQKVRWGDMDLIALAEDRDRWSGTCECQNDPSGSIKCGEFLDYMRTCSLHRKDCAPWNYLEHALPNDVFLQHFPIRILY